MVGSVGQGQEWCPCPEDTERVSVAELLDTPLDRCIQPQGRNQEGNKAAEPKEINHCEHGSECLFDENSLQGDSVWCYLWFKSENHAQKKNMGH